jgi:predicted enzyme involved in methoxymalonyl-ACP biosynthesis
VAPGYLETIQLDKALDSVAPTAIDACATRLRVALLSSTTINHLAPGLRVAALRRGFFFDVFAGGFGQYRQELLDPATPLQAFAPHVIVLSLSARPMVNGIAADADLAQVERLLAAEIAELRRLWDTARRRFSAVVIQQTYLDVFDPLFGSFDRMAAAAPARVVARLNDLLAEATRDDGVSLVPPRAMESTHGST